MINSLQSLRGIFAIMTFMHHWHFDSGVQFMAGGDCGVAFFIMLSGFVMYAAHRDRPIGDYKDYITKRIIRIYPLHLLCLIVALYLDGFFVSPGPGLLPVASNLMLLQSWVPLPEYYFSGNSVSWCLSDLLFCYAVFPLLFGVMRAHFRAVLKTVGIVIVGYLCLICFVPSDLVTPLAYINPSFRILDFVLGMILAHFYFGGCLKAPESAVGKNVMETGAVLLLVAAVLCYGLVPERFAVASYWWAVVATVIAVFAVTDRRGGWLTRVLDCRMLVLFGNVSFSFYMIHVLFVRTLDIICGKAGIVLSGMPKLAVYLLLTIVTAYICNRLFEQPVSRLLLRVSGFGRRK